MQIVNVPIYKFDELSDEAKRRAIEDHRDYLRKISSREITGKFAREFASKLDPLGYPSSNIQWGRGYCQGDGVAFYGHIDRDNLRQIAQRLLGAKVYKDFTRVYNAGCDGSYVIRPNSYGLRYSHCNTMYVEFEDYTRDWDRVDEVFELLRGAITKEIKEVSIQLEELGYKIIEAQESDESVLEELKVLDYDFLVSGKRFDQIGG